MLNFHTLPSTQLSPKMSWILIFNGITQHPHQCIHWLIITAEGEASRQSFGHAQSPLHPVFLKRPNHPKNAYYAVSGDTKAHQTHSPVAKQTTKHIILIRVSFLDASCLLSDMTFQARAAELTNLSYLGIQGAEKKRERQADRRTAWSYWPLYRDWSSSEL